MNYLDQNTGIIYTHYSQIPEGAKIILVDNLL